MDDGHIRYLKYRLKALPIQLERARRRLQHLEREARRLGLAHLIQSERNDP